MTVDDGTKTTKTNGIIVQELTSQHRPPHTHHFLDATAPQLALRSSTLKPGDGSRGQPVSTRSRTSCSQRCSRFAVTLVADSMDASGLTARDSRSARARPRAGRGALVGRLPLARPQHGQVQRGFGPDVATVFTRLTARDSRSDALGHALAEAL